MKYIKLSEACDFQGGSQPPKDEWSFDLKDGYVRMLQIRDFTQSGKTVPEYVKFTNRLKMCCEDDILIARYGASLGKILTGLAGAYNVAIIKAIPDLRILEKRFLYYYLKSPVFQTALFNVGVRAAQAGFNKEDLRELLIPDISKDKQLEIVSTLERIERILLLKQKQSQILDNLIKARFVEMFAVIRETVPLSYYISSLIAGKSLAGEEECQNKVLKTGAVTYDYFIPSQVKNLPKDYLPLSEHQIKDGDVIISRMNTAELVGAAAYVWKAPQNTYLPDRLWRADLKNDVNPVFIWQVIVQPEFKNAIKNIAGGTSGSMKNISKSGLLGLSVIKVPYHKQNEFASFVQQVDKSKVAVQKSLEQTQMLFDSLMQQYFG